MGTERFCINRAGGVIGESECGAYVHRGVVTGESGGGAYVRGGGVTGEGWGGAFRFVPGGGVTGEGGDGAFRSNRAGDVTGEGGGGAYVRGGGVTGEGMGGVVRNGVCEETYGSVSGVSRCLYCARVFRSVWGGMFNNRGFFMSFSFLLIEKFLRC